MCCRGKPLHSIAFVLALLPGCYGSRVGIGDDDGGQDDDASTSDDDTTHEDDDTSTPDDDTTPAADLRLLEIDPDHGSTEGGYLVTLSYEGDLGTEDEDEVDVLFGEVPADVVAVTNDQVLVTAPEACLAEELDVRLEGPAGADEEEFLYEPWATGLDAAVFGAYRTEDRRNSPVLTSGLVELGFFEPNASPPLGHLPPLETCTPNIIPPDYNRDYVQVGNSLVLSAGMAVSVPWNGSEEHYVNGNVTLSALPPSSSFSITGATSPGGCPLELDDVLRSPDGLTVVQPTFAAGGGECWYMQDACTGVPPLGILEWSLPSSSQPGDAVFIQFTNNDTGALEYLCHVQDDGSFVLDQTDLLQMSQGWKTVLVNRYRRTSTVDPASGATRHGVFVDSEIGYIAVFLTDQECQLCF
jgi:hypothetical protein